MAARLISLAEARELVLAEARPLPAEDVPVGDALGRVLAEEVTSAHDLPPFDSSAMDGLAVVGGAGDGLVPPGSPLGPGQIRDSNAAALSAQATTAGARVESVEHAADQRAATTAALEGALRAADVVCISGGVSVGEHDHVKPS